MTDPLSPPTPPRPPIRSWRATEQDLWLDCLLTFAELLMADTLSKTTKDEAPWTDTQTRAALRADLEQAAILADGAIEETQYREFIQKTAPPKRRSRAGGRSKGHSGSGGGSGSGKGQGFRN